MQTLFEMALAFLIMMTFINAGFYVFGNSIAGINTFEKQEGLTISQTDVSNSFKTTESTVKEGNAFDAIYTFVGTLFGAITGAVGIVTQLVNVFLSFGNAWSVVLTTIFSKTGLLWDFISLAIIPLINLMQFGSIVYILLYAVSAGRGGGG